jgi:hypothetical protein
MSECTDIVPFSLRGDWAAVRSLPQRLFSLQRCDEIGGRDAWRQERVVRIHQGWRDDGRGGSDLGFGAAVYDSAVALSMLLRSEADSLCAGQRVAELGCGTGLVSIAAAASGAATVWCTDGDAGVLDSLTRKSVADSLTEEERGRVFVQQYMWCATRSIASRLCTDSHRPRAY